MALYVPLLLREGPVQVYWVDGRLRGGYAAKRRPDCSLLRPAVARRRWLNLSAGGSGMIFGR